jgi:hypothetical protein
MIQWAIQATNLEISKKCIKIQDSDQEFPSQIKQTQLNHCQLLIEKNRDD